MFLVEVKDYKGISKRGARFLIEEIKKSPKIVIGFATGETPLGVYNELINSYKKKEINFSLVKTFNLDEYYPISKVDKNSYYYYMFQNLFNNLNISKFNVNILNGECNDPKKECEDYEKKLKKTPIDIQILGVGINGHIGFNEPGSGLNSKTRLVNLSEDTRKVNSRFFKKIENVPKKALTMGISDIMSSKKIVLLVSGKNKAKALKALIDGPVDKKFPVSFLKKHKNLIVIADKNARRLI